MKKFGGTLLHILGSGMFCLFFLAAMYCITRSDTMPSWYLAVFGLLALVGAGATIAGRSLCRRSGEGPRARKFSGALLVLLGVAYIAIALFWLSINCESITYRAVQTHVDFYTEIEWMTAASGILDALGILQIVLGVRKYHRAKPAPAQTPEEAKAAPEAEPEKPAEPAEAICPSCGKRYSPDRIYCEECGTLLERK